MNGTGKNVAPIGSVKVICDHNERKKKIETVNTMNNRKSAGMQLLDSYTTTSRAIITNNDRDKRAHHKYNNNQSLSIPIPANGHRTQYLKRWKYFWRMKVKLMLST